MPSSIMELEANSGIFPVEGADPKRLFIAKLWNFIEPVALYGIALNAVWATLLSKSTMAIWIPLVVGVVIWLIIFSPIVHYHFEKDLFLKPEQQNLGFYCAECRGFGSPRKYFIGDREKNEPPLFKKHKRAIITLLILFGIQFSFAAVAFWNYPEFNSIMTSLHLPTTDGAKIGMVIALIAILLVVLFFGFSVVVRFDTLVKGAKQSLILFAITVPVLLLMAWIFILIPALPYWPLQGVSPDDLTVTKYAFGFSLLGVFIALFIGFAFVTRKDAPVKRSTYIIVMLVIGILLGLLWTWLFFFSPAITASSNPLPSNFQTATIDKLINFNIFAFDGQWTGYVWWGFVQQMLILSVFNTMFSRAFDIKKRSSQLLAGLWTGFFFGFFHLPTFWLSFGTWIVGFMWGMYFMRSRNLFSMGVVHGGLGTLFNELTPIKFSVGPSTL